MIREVIDVIPKEKWDIYIHSLRINESDTPVYVVSILSKEGLDIENGEEFASLVQDYGIDSEYQKSSEDGGRCTVGFSTRDNKWYGWSHRAICGFTTGASCKRGDVHYKTSDFDEYRFGGDGVLGCSNLFEDYSFCDSEVELRCLNDMSILCNEGNCQVFKKGRGEWVAESLEDAFEMACDFAKAIR